MDGEEVALVLGVGEGEEEEREEAGELHFALMRLSDVWVPGRGGCRPNERYER